MQSNSYGEDLKNIREMMDRSTRFLTLSGLSGVLAGCYALAGAFLAYFILESARNDGYQNRIETLFVRPLSENSAIQLLLLAIVVLFLAVFTAYILTRRKARKMKQHIWTRQTYRLMGAFATPLIAGGLFTLCLWKYELIGLIAPAMLLFYGLGCVQASKYTFGTIKHLGYTCILLGLLNTQFIGYGLYFWALGFGVCHILYGLVMYMKYDRN